MSEIFLSYSRHDVDKARQLPWALEDERFMVFWDRHIQAGQNFDQVIRRELDEAGAVVVLWSQDSVASDWAKDEAERAKARGVLVPVAVDDVPLPLGFGRVQTAEIRVWRGGPSYEAVTQIAGAARAVMTSPPVGLPGRRSDAPPRPPRPRRHRGRTFVVVGAVPAVAPAGADEPVAEGEITTTGAGPVRLAIDQNRDTLRFFVDDELVHENAMPGVARSGPVGFLVESINAEVAHVHFDYLAVAVAGGGA